MDKPNSAPANILKTISCHICLSQSNPSTMQKEDLTRLLTDIRTGKCALVLGPEIFDVAGQPLQQFVKSRLLENFGEQIAGYYERDGFFLLKNAEDKPEMQDEVQHIYRGIQPDAGLLQRIVEIPFSLVLSVNPDTFLRDLSFRNGLPNRFAWFDARRQEEFVLPDDGETDGPALRERIPLYYNLCGCIEKPGTLVLDYDDLFRLLEWLLSAPKLPANLTARLKDTTSYLFLGFQFDRWHTQLLLRLLDVKNSARRLALRSPEVPADTRAFLLNHFRIKFMGNEDDILQQLYDAFDAAGQLRQVASADSDIIASLQSGNLAGAVARAVQVTKGRHLADDATQLSSRFHFWSAEKSKGTMDVRDVSLEFNRLTDSVLQLAKRLNEP